ncbi:uncharacterized protein LOC125501964 [Athalia rosae]|uniref:uncharacterized protein LOC125501964 n=1 Tax=Athalia rosae TaxID=37344 RepID=UPI002033DBB6|nr:uncharacterized protein LOC125501629 isoform X2 [Athalia rosae]XP_048515194.1 uncharacterized protein LOC125501964 [Athalia rosae]
MITAIRFILPGRTVFFPEENEKLKRRSPCGIRQMLLLHPCVPWQKVSASVSLGKVQLPTASMLLLCFWKRHREFEEEEIHVSFQEPQSFHNPWLWNANQLEKLGGLYKKNYNHGIQNACINLHRSYNFQAYYYIRIPEIKIHQNSMRSPSKKIGIFISDIEKIPRL